MSALQSELLKTTDGLSDDSIKSVIKYVRKYIAPFDTNKTASSADETVRKLGSCKGMKLIADGYDIDDFNDEIEELFGVND